MNGNLRIGKIGGIPIGLNPSWFLIFGLLTWSLANGMFPAEFPGLPGVWYWALAAVTSILFFGSVLLHELGHSVIAIRNGIPVRNITLFIFGGVAQITREPRTPGAEFRIAIAGPLVSLALAALFGGAWMLDRNLAEFAAPSLWLARINLSLALFNMIPGFPLDGGRILRSLIWKWSGSYTGATRVASITGRLVAYGFIAFGVWLAFTGDVVNGIWIAFIGWFLQNAASASYAQVRAEQSLRGIRVDQVMARDGSLVPPEWPLDVVVNQRVLSGQQFFVVAVGDRPVGLVTLADIARVPREQWRYRTLGQIMTPWERLTRVRPETDLANAIQEMDTANVAQAPVVEENQVRGMLTREQVLRFLRLRAQFGA